MKHLRSISLGLLASALCFFVCGCYTPHYAVDMAPTFTEGAYANLVVKFYKWDNIYIMRPDYREDGYTRSLRRETIPAALDELRVRRDLAVIVIGWNYGAGETAQIVEGWETLLGGQGFQRVVCIRATEENKLDGSPVIDDWKRPGDAAQKTAKL
jgi:hypothetical protein